MIVTKHKPDCPLSAWQLQMKIENGNKEYRAQCLNCGATSPVTDTEANNWNRSGNDDLIKIGMPEIKQ